MSYGKPEKEKAYDYVTITLFGEARDSNLRKVMSASGNADPYIWVTFSDTQIERIIDPDGDSLTLHQVNLVRIFRDYVKYKAAINERLHPTMYATIDNDEFDDYRIGPNFPFDYDKILQRRSAAASISGVLATAPSMTASTPPMTMSFNHTC
jgi:hypothetical protein